MDRFTIGLEILRTPFPRRKFGSPLSYPNLSLIVLRKSERHEIPGLLATSVSLGFAKTNTPMIAPMRRKGKHVSRRKGTFQPTPLEGPACQVQSFGGICLGSPWWEFAKHTPLFG